MLIYSRQIKETCPWKLFNELTPLNNVSYEYIILCKILLKKLY
jgi:hypothetical protein